VQTLGQIGTAHTDQVVPALRAALKDWGAWDVREGAALALWQVGSAHADQKMVPALLLALKDGRWEIRQAGARAAATVLTISITNVIAILQSLLASENLTAVIHLTNSTNLEWFGAVLSAQNKISPSQGKVRLSSSPYSLFASSTASISSTDVLLKNGHLGGLSSSFKF
jgi:HEAT repeat protein